MGSGDEVVLLDEYVSMFGMRPRVALALKGIRHESREEDLQNKSPLLLEMNPVHKKIPVLIHNGKPICESLIVVEYIDEVWKEQHPLLPTDPYKRAQARFWADYVDKKVFQCVRGWIRKWKDEEAIYEEMIENLKVLEGVLGEEPYFGGESFGFLDLAVITFYTWFLACEKECKFTFESKCPKLIGWGKRCLQNQTISNSIADPLKLYEFVLQLRKRLGVH
nr:probable glutathione S-transferase parC [Ipomoea trifida]